MTQDAPAGVTASGPLTGITANRRDILRTATGLAAAAIVGGGVFADSQQVAHAQSDIQQMTLTIEGLPEGLNSAFVYSFSWGVANASGAGGGSGKNKGKATLSSLNLMKNMDEMTPLLALAAAQGTTFASATLTSYDTVGEPFFSYELRQVFVESVQVSGSAGGGVPTESLSLAYNEIRLTVGGSAFNWNVATAKSS